MSASEGAPGVVVVGAGLSGVACAREVRAAGLRVRVLDRGRKPGGRMASRRLWDRPVDLGASYLTTSDEDFLAVVEGWRERGLARPWTDTFCALGDGDPVAKTGPLRWGAPGGLRSLVEDLAAGLDGRAVRRREGVDALDGAAVVLAMPDPQARRLVGDDHPLSGPAGPRVRAGPGHGRHVGRAQLGPRQPDGPLRRRVRQRPPGRGVGGRRRTAAG